jgi:hypothetical protein
MKYGLNIIAGPDASEAVRIAASGSPIPASQWVHVLITAAKPMSTSAGRLRQELGRTTRFCGV